MNLFSKPFQDFSTLIFFFFFEKQNVVYYHAGFVLKPKESKGGGVMRF